MPTLADGLSGDLPTPDSHSSRHSPVGIARALHVAGRVRDSCCLVEYQDTPD